MPRLLGIPGCRAPSACRPAAELVTGQRGQPRRLDGSLARGSRANPGPCALIRATVAEVATPRHQWRPAAPTSSIQELVAGKRAGGVSSPPAGADAPAAFSVLSRGRRGGRGDRAPGPSAVCWLLIPVLAPDCRTAHQVREEAASIPGGGGGGAPGAGATAARSPEPSRGRGRGRTVPGYAHTGERWSATGTQADLGAWPAATATRSG